VSLDFRMSLDGLHACDLGWIGGVPVLRVLRGSLGVGFTAPSARAIKTKANRGKRSNTSERSERFWCGGAALCTIAPACA
jgi:hypothetical protein